jgi:hypothetical protein
MVSCSTGCDINLFAESIARDLNEDWQVALGFECPLFVPIPDDPRELTSARQGDGDRPWSAGAGAGSLAIGLTECQWVLDRVRSLVNRDIPVFFRWAPFRAAGVGLFVWEAFVTKEAKADTHHEDAELAVKSFRDGLPNPERLNAVMSANVRSLIGAALLQAGWTGDVSFLRKPCLVVRVRPIPPGPADQGTAAGRPRE